MPRTPTMHLLIGRTHTISIAGLALASKPRGAARTPVLASACAWRQYAYNARSKLSCWGGA
eukprot:8777988-Lingulodinium_polyedra.AAC.1